jgi:hypothetical protein
MNSFRIEILKESDPKDSAVLAALHQFYKGFNEGDIDLLSENWSQSAAAIMSNPLGGVLKGWSKIEGLYQRLFSGPIDVNVEFYDIEINQWSNGFLAVGREKGRVTLGKGSSNMQSSSLEIRTSRFFIFDEDKECFKQLHHHGSIVFPDMLASYQELVNKANH